MHAGASSTRLPAAADPRPLSRTILVVDDEEGVRILLARWLEACGYGVAPVRDADAALRRLAESPVAVMVADLRMAGRDGLWLAARVRQQFPDVAVIIASGVQDVEAIVETMRCGVVDHLVKPFGRDRLRDAVRRGLEWHQTACEARAWRETLEQDLAVRTARLCRAVRAFVIRDDDAADAMLASLVLDDRDAYGHAVRVAQAARETGKLLGLEGAALEVLARAALLHDIGKLALPDAVRRKPAPLTAEEHALVRGFPQLGAEILATVPYLASAAPLVRDAHEHMDGHGYPRGVPAATVSLAARIIGVADAFDAMTHARPFRGAVCDDEAIRVLERRSGSQFDPAVVAAFLRVRAGR